MTAKSAKGMWAHGRATERLPRPCWLVGRSEVFTPCIQHHQGGATEGRRKKSPREKKKRKKNGRTRQANFFLAVTRGANARGWVEHRLLGAAGQRLVGSRYVSQYDGYCVILPVNLG